MEEKNSYKDEKSIKMKGERRQIKLKIIAALDTKCNVIIKP